MELIYSDLQRKFPVRGRGVDFKDTKVILYVGRPNKEKGLETLINAFVYF